MTELDFVPLTSEQIRVACSIFWPSFEIVKGYPALSAPLGDPTLFRPEEFSGHDDRNVLASYVESFNWIDLTDWIEGPMNDSDAVAVQEVLVRTWQCSLNLLEFSIGVSARPLSPEDTGDWFGVGVRVM